MKNVKTALAKPANSASSPWALWIWNRSITGLEIEKQLNAFISNGFGGVAIRPGRDMSPSYMSQEFLDNFRLVLDIAKQHKIGVRLADDMSLAWVGCFESAVSPSRKLRAEYLKLDREITDDQDGDISIDPECEYMAQAIKKVAKNAQTIDVKQITIPVGKSSFRWKAPGSDWRLLLYKREPAISPTGSGVPNVMSSKSVQNYMQNTLEALKSAVSEFAPSTFEGFVTEVPALRSGAGAIFWDDDIAVKYKSRYKREFMPFLPYLFLDISGAEKIRSQLHRFIYEIMVEKFVLALDAWAKKYRLTQWALWPETGIYRLENALCDGYIPSETAIATLGLQNIDGSFDNFALLRTAADINANQYRRDTITVVGRNRGALGSGPQDLKREMDMSLLSGQSRILIDGFYFNNDRRNYYKTPCSPFIDSPEWEQMALLCSYSAKTQDLIAGMQRSREIAVLSLPDAIMTDYTPGNSAAAANGLARFKKTIDALCGFGKTFDVITEELLLACVVRQSGDFATADRVRRGNYQALVIPHATYVSRRLLVYLEKIAVKGAILVFIDEAPLGTFEDGGSASVVSRIQKLVSPKRENVFVLPVSEIEQALANVKSEMTVLRESGEIAEIAVQTYHGDSGRIHILHNIHDDAEQIVIAEVPSEKFFAAIDCATGEAVDIEPIDVDKNTVRLRLSFSPLQTMIIAASATRIGSQSNRDPNLYMLPQRSYRIIFKNQWDFEPLSANVLPLSNWNVRIGLSRESGQISHFYETNFEIKDYPHAPGECALIMSGMSYGETPFQGLEVSVNGIRIDGAPLEKETHWRESLPVKILGNGASCFEVGDKMIKGLNRISIRTTGIAIDPQTLVYPPLIVGDFSIVKGGHGLAIDKAGISAGHDTWTKHGYPYMSGCARYSQIFEVPNDYDRLVLRFSKVSGTVSIKINDLDVGTLYWPPMEIDVTKYCNIQRNKLSVEVVNTLDNILRLSGRASGLLGEVYIDVYKI